jgi:hypothetical protein
MKFNYTKKNTKLNYETILQKRNFDKVLNEFNVATSPKSFWNKNTYAISFFSVVAIVASSVFLFNNNSSNKGFEKIETSQKQLVLQIENKNDLKPIAIQGNIHTSPAKENVIEKENVVNEIEVKNESALENQSVQAKKLNFTYQNYNLSDNDVFTEQNNDVSILVNSVEIQNILKDSQVKTWTNISLKEIPDNQIIKTILAVNDEITEFKGNILDGNARRLVLKAKGNDEIIFKVKYLNKEGTEKEFQINKKVQISKSSF